MDERQHVVDQIPKEGRHSSFLARAKVLSRTNDSLSVFRLTRQAAEAEEAGGWTCLGNLYARGVGTKRSMKLASKCYLRAHRDGDARGTGLLGMCRVTGAGIEKDRDEGLKLLHHASCLEDETAMRNIAWLFRYGSKHGVAQSEKEADMWLKTEQKVKTKKHLQRMKRRESLPSLHKSRGNTEEAGEQTFLSPGSSSATLLSPPDFSAMPDGSVDNNDVKNEARYDDAIHKLQKKGEDIRSQPEERAQENLLVAKFEGTSSSKLHTQVSSHGNNSQSISRPSLPKSLSRRQSMATLMNPLNSMVQTKRDGAISEAKRGHLESSGDTISKGREKIITDLPVHAAFESAQHALQRKKSIRKSPSLSLFGKDYSHAVASDPLLPRTTPRGPVTFQESNCSVKVLGAKNEREADIEASSQKIVPELSETRKEIVDRIGEWDLFISQCDVRHIGIPLGCAAFSAMWRAITICFAKQIGVDFEGRRVPVLAPFLLYFLRGTWYTMWCFTATLYALFLTLYVYRGIRTRLLLLQDFEDPILTNFFAAIGIVAAVLLITVPPPFANERGIESIFALLFAYKVFLSVGFWYTDWLFSTGHNSLRRTSPIFFMAVINLFLLSTIAANIALTELSVFLFLLGTLMWLVVFTTSFSFIAKTYEDGVDKPSPTLFCFLAPPAAAGVAWITISKARALDPLNDVTRFFAAVLFFLIILLMRLAPMFCSLSFNVGWWAYVFPLGSAATSTVFLSSLYDNNSAMLAISYAFCMATTSMFGVVGYLTVCAVIGREIPKSPDSLETYAAVLEEQNRLSRWNVAGSRQDGDINFV